MCTSQNGLQLNIGDAWTVACPVMLAFYVLQTGKYAEVPNPMARVTVIMGVCTIGSLLCVIATPKVDWFPQDFNFWKGVLFSSIFGTVYMYSIQTYVQRFIAEEKVALAYLTQPVFATLSAVIFINEKVTVSTFIGGVFILTAMFLSEIKTDRLRKSLIKLK